MTTYIPQLTLPYEVFASPAASILLPVGLGTLVGFSTRPSETKKKYMALKQPPFHPPAYVFGPAWTALYGLMGYGAYRAVSTGLAPLSSVEHIRITKHGATLYTIQLGLNLAWMPLFFGLKRPVEATVDILALLGTTGYLTYIWGSVDKVAGWCFAPYVAWLSYATYLCVGAAHLNNWDLKDKEVSKEQ